LTAQRIGRGWVISGGDVEIARRETTTSVIPATSYTESTAEFKALSFFSGAMGLDLGLERAGVDTRLACEFDKWARQTIATNRPDIPVLGDIWKYNAQDILDLAGIREGEEVDLIAGGPPCQAFSTAGARRGFDDLRGNVFLHYIDLIGELRPRYAVIENVRGLLSMPVSEPQALALFEETGIDFSMKHGAIRLVAHRLRESGYSVSFNLYNSANFGTPQNRERVVIIASREGGPVPYLKPTHSDDPSTGLPAWKTVRETFSAMPKGEPHFIPFPESRLRYYRLLGPGQYWKDLPKDLQPEAMGGSYPLPGGKTGFYRRISWDRPSPTLVTHPAMPATDLGHPVEDRPLSVEEYKRIQQFPDEWMIAGNLQQQYKQIGNAVPLGLGEAIGRAIVAHSRGEMSTVPDGFKYSRYKLTSDKEIAPSPEDVPPDYLF
jgi:DNA (cytosine-5)-methyltransferase 1